jgi:protein TonB
LVDTSGNITEVKVENPEYVHPKVGAEAVRVIQQGPKWLPATINGGKVIYRQKQSITFMVSQV